MVQGLARLLDSGSSIDQLIADAERPDQQVVKAEASLSGNGLQPGDKFQVDTVLLIADGWHVNANPASQEQLIPVTVTLDSSFELKDARTDYPKGQPFTVEGIDESIAVYGGRVSIRSYATLSEDARPGQSTIKIGIRYQACDDVRCLTPRKIELVVPVEIVKDDGSSE
jgi:hypothetical protein